MSIHGVFFVAIFLLLSPLAHCAVDMETEGSLGYGDFVQEWKLGLSYNWDQLCLDSTWKASYAEDQLGAGLSDWELVYDPDFPFKLTVSRHRAHHTSPDAFRLIYRNNYQSETACAVVETSRITAGLFRNLPIKKRRLAGALLLQGEFGRDPFTIGATAIPYETGYNYELDREAGTYYVGQAEADFSNIHVMSALGLHHRILESSGKYREEDIQAAVCEVEYDGEDFHIEADLIRVEPGFESIFASTNKYASDRMGYQYKVGVPLKDVKITFSRRQYSRIDGTRHYPQFIVELENHDKETCAQLKLQPTESFIIRREQGENALQIDFVKQTLRFDSTLFDMNGRLSIDFADALTRFETKFTLWADWRFILKRDFLENRHYFFASARKEQGDRYVQFEWGKYDRGNIRSYFDEPAHLRISWGWKF